MRSKKRQKKKKRPRCTILPLSARVPCVRANVFVYICSCEWLLMHSHMGVHACLICGVNFVVPLPPSSMMGNSPMRG